MNNILLDKIINVQEPCQDPPVSNFMQFLLYPQDIYSQGRTGTPGTCQVGRLVRRPGGPPRQMLKWVKRLTPLTVKGRQDRERRVRYSPKKGEREGGVQ